MIVDEPRSFLVVVGTRPEAIKMMPLVRELSGRKDVDVRVCVTGQHREMLDQVLRLYDVIPDYDLDLLGRKTGLHQLSAGILDGLEKVLEQYRPDNVLVHGDTCTTAISTIAAFYSGIPVAHVEAGLRTGDLNSPWPEEGNRRLVGGLAKYHFAPTAQAKSNLLKEGVPSKHIWVTGNTVIDSLQWVLKFLEKNESAVEKLTQRFNFLKPDRKTMLVTAHRRESFGQGLVNICNGIAEVVNNFPDIQMVFPVHLNPNVQEPVKKILGSLENIHLLEPLDYLSFSFLMKASDIILTDSGGIQEEAPTLGKPVLVMRDNTERPEALQAGVVKLVGTDPRVLVSEVAKLLNDRLHYDAMSKAKNPYGDGLASQRIADILLSGSATEFNSKQ